MQTCNNVVGIGIADYRGGVLSSGTTTTTGSNVLTLQSLQGMYESLLQPTYAYGYWSGNGSPGYPAPRIRRTLSIVQLVLGINRYR